MFHPQFRSKSPSKTSVTVWGARPKSADGKGAEARNSQMIRFSYRLTGSGWAVAELSDEKSEARIPASYLCDALRDFVVAVEDVFSAESGECLWEEEPGEVHWKFQRTGDRVTCRGVLEPGTGDV